MNVGFMERIRWFRRFDSSFGLPGRCRYPWAKFCRSGP
ncbi:hypothetical protein AN403_5985 [Pseudomonas fluorescens]|uniref:Uncharacterized protein n=1 Tax=Pseudomonas fluorescens TaxID=294 RepID=A0A0P8X6X1_PSEFL|nr:hypothetical protein AN403_5985 [Pseudomonas fluorescens]